MHVRPRDQFRVERLALDARGASSSTTTALVLAPLFARAGFTTSSSTGADRFDERRVDVASTTTTGASSTVTSASGSTSITSGFLAFRDFFVAGLFLTVFAFLVGGSTSTTSGSSSGTTGSGVGSTTGAGTGVGVGVGASTAALSRACNTFFNPLVGRSRLINSAFKIATVMSATLMVGAATTSTCTSVSASASFVTTSSSVGDSPTTLSTISTTASSTASSSSASISSFSGTTESFRLFTTIFCFSTSAGEGSKAIFNRCKSSAFLPLIERPRSANFSLRSTTRIVLRSSLGMHSCGTVVAASV
eukprot:m.66471 g.66471  ORF g.66471 m.66471 type:complete len:305 (-) comp23694_c0_seq1:280-1194(-)